MLTGSIGKIWLRCLQEKILSFVYAMLFYLYFLVLVPHKGCTVKIRSFGLASGLAG